MEQTNSRLPVVHQPRYPVRSPAMTALATTARKGAALMAAGAVARFVVGQLAEQLVKRGATVPARPSATIEPVDSPATVVEEVVYFRRRIYRR